MKKTIISLSLAIGLLTFNQFSAATDEDKFLPGITIINNSWNTIFVSIPGIVQNHSISFLSQFHVPYPWAKEAINFSEKSFNYTINISSTTNTNICTIQTHLKISHSFTNNDYSFSGSDPENNNPSRCVVSNDSFLPSFLYTEVTVR